MRRHCRLLVSALVPLLLMQALPEAHALSRSTLAQYQDHLEQLRTLVASCETAAAACDAKAVGEDEQVGLAGLGVGSNVNSFEAHYDWLRDTLASARNAGDNSRADKLQAAKARLDTALSEASGEGAAGPGIAIARQKADAILGNPEFATVHEDSIWDRVWAHVLYWLDRLFNSVARFGTRSPWIGPVIEWGLIGLALVGLAVWAMRVLQRQRLAVRVEAERQIEPWEEAARNWRTLAEEQAASGNWREAVHCLYWASIAVLEGRRMWTPNRSRTPREYVRLLEAGSSRWRLLRQQTQGFEHIWYGLRDAAKQDYERALALHQQLKAGN